MRHPHTGGGFDEGVRKTVQQIPLLQTRAGPRDGELWQARLREELQALIAFVRMNKESDHDWCVPCRSLDPPSIDRASVDACADHDALPRAPQVLHRVQ